MENKTISEQLGEISEKQDKILAAVNKSGARTVEDDRVQRSVNQRNQSWSLKNFIRRSVHEYIWEGTEEEFDKDRKVSLILILASIVSMVLCTVFTTVSFGYYTTFTLFENIWLLLLFYVLKYTFKTKKNYLAYTYSQNSFERFVTDGDGVLRNVGYKKKYKFFYILACISIVLNILSSWIIEESTLPIPVTVFEIIAFAVNIITVNKVTYFFAGYGSIRFTGMNETGTGKVVLVYDPMLNKLFTEEEYLARFPSMK